MNYIRRANERGQVNMGWLNSQHSFSFGNYFDRKHMGVSVLRVINDDVVKPGTGFGMHGHADMEIISYVVNGELAHTDNQGNTEVIPAGDVQIMSAGSGIVHSEFNPSQTDDVNFLQIWLLPKELGITPRYEQKTIVQNEMLTPIVTPNGDNGSLSINQDASLYRLVLKADEEITLNTEQRQGYLHIVKGKLTADDVYYSQGDAFTVNSGKQVKIWASADIEAIWFDLPQVMHA
jgi:redox-sensitive bicupin YhaK (pirin superfamily)